ncbi:DUF1002 domain-containing protein [Blautia massiliensis (ex Durand et al. 2017)]|uniref:DUF1002 domain-containing protein n=1 Tax=Blautia massiliensis (ex Durand et al. 2017) TaxID=1737424 RepID=UPI00241EFDF2|nr:DUF1002 domain-containing protein [Blautia massiliensis (ex Durand et al. 2017)]MBN2957453.1 DUF1002 domain-containing protein [Blautia massiliensis (ex Durand et al. 2017)]
MKKRNMIAALLCSACLVAGSVNPVFADASKVVTLGADLTDAQKQTMMKYFNVSSDQVQVMTITNEDEHKHLDNIAPQSQIGSRTLSCAYVKPTQSGGIKVRTANLNWVTGNMIATTLSTSGVKNCEVVAACPMEVSGTGALTGIQMAYEKASGEKLDETKTKLANQEIVTTGELADKVGKNEATTVVNQSKMDVIQNGVQNADEIQNIVINVAEQNNISISQDDIDRIVSLLGQIAQQDYNYDDVKETLEQVDANTTGQASSSDDTLDGESSDDTVDVDEDSSDDIVNNVNDSILGDDVIQSSTEDPGLEKETGADSQDTSNETGIPDATDDGTYGNEENSDESSTDESTSDESSTDDSASDESSTDESASDENSTDDSASDETGIPEATEDTESSESTDSSDQADSAENDTSVLSEEAKNNYDKFVLFVKGEYEGDAESLLAATEDTEAVATVILDEQTAKSVAETVEKDYYDILKDGTESYEADGTEKYQSTELNMMDQKLKKLFGIESSQDDTDDTDATDVAAAILADVPQEDKQTLYKETMKYLAGLYGENTDASEESAAE